MDSHVICCKMPMLLFICVYAIVLKPAQAISNNLEDPNRGFHEKRLYYEIFEKGGYNPLIRPVKNSNESLRIHFSLALSQIIDVDEKNQMMKSNVWLQVYWNDTQLKWDPALYGNIDTIYPNPDKIWVPDFVLFNNADGSFEVTYKSNTVVSHTALVYWIPPAIYKSSCSIDVQYFPFDQQICEMKFGSWTHKGKALTYSFYNHFNKLDLVDYLRSGSWDIIDCPGRIDTLIDEAGGDHKQIIVFKFILRRKTLFYTVNLIIPCVLISFVSVCVFALPADAGEKITLCISVLLALVVFLLLVSKILPPSLTIPLIAKYLLFTFIMNLISIFSTVVIINRNYRTPRTHQMPQWIRVLFIKTLPRYLFIERPDHEQRWEGKPPSPPASSASTIECPRQTFNYSRNCDFLELTEVHHPHCKLNTPNSTKKESDCGQSISSSQSHINRNYTKLSPDRQQSSGCSNQLNMTPELCKTIESINFIHHHLKTEEEYEIVLEDWKYVARVLDRLLLVIFFLVTLAGTVGILLNAPHILEYVDQEKIIKSIIKHNNDQKDNASVDV